MNIIDFKGTQDELQALLGATSIVLLDFKASWCGRCKMLAPVLDNLAVEREDVLIVKIDIDENEDVKQAYVPTLIAMVDGEEFSRANGFKPLAVLHEMLP